jgi:2-polyprenyl-3-methyl-5-hydroxy-6-metoxy-1,4-benzoquinol methylase
MTGECLRLVRIVGRLPAEEADRQLEDLSPKLRTWLQSLETPSKDTYVAELPGLQGYTLWADTYDGDPDNRVILAEEDYIWTLIGDVQGKRVLDAGSGTGRHALRLAEKGADVVASEPNETLLRIARSKAVRTRCMITWMNNSIETLPPGVGTFDLVLCCLVLSHVEDIRAALLKLAGLLNENGRLIVSDFHPFNLMIGWRTSFFHGGYKYVVPNYLHLPSEYFGAMKSCGLVVEDFLEVGSFPQLPDQPATIILQGHKRMNRSRT